MPAVTERGVAARSQPFETACRSTRPWGFTPLEGVPMASRSGSIDSGALLYPIQASDLDPESIDHVLNFAGDSVRLS
jgi:acetate kinase